jgi:D-alanyl-D-alanine dipeptidase
VLARLGQAQTRLQEQQPGWRLQIFDAYRPIPVQGFMVNYAFQELVQDQGLDAQNLSPEQEQRLWDQVGQFWAEPSPDPTMPPPHSTGAAVDVTLVDGEDTPVDMGSPIDELSPRSYPDHFAQDPSPEAQQYHGARLLLRQVMVGAGFCNHPQEWWHFSYGDQRWAWLLDQVKPLEQPRVACYGTVT